MNRSEYEQWYIPNEPKEGVLMIGSYGTIPRPVSVAKEKLRVQIEGNPDRFMKRDWLPLLNDVRESAAIIGAEAEECVIVPNTTHGVNTILHNIKWTPGDRIVICKFLSFPHLIKDGMGCGIEKEGMN
jgi:selenocysteine lyase/cysteine desulfurase